MTKKVNYIVISIIQILGGVIGIITIIPILKSLTLISIVGLVIWIFSIYSGIKLLNSKVIYSNINLIFQIISFQLLNIAEYNYTGFGFIKLCLNFIESTLIEFEFGLGVELSLKLGPIVDGNHICLNIVPMAFLYFLNSKFKNI